MGKHTVTLLPSGSCFEVEPQESILDAALRNNQPLAHRCRVGVCSTCLCKVVSGEVSYTLEPMLTDDEKEQGWVFACVAHPVGNVVLDTKA